MSEYKIYKYLPKAIKNENDYLDEVSMLDGLKRGAADVVLNLTEILEELYKEDPRQLSDDQIKAMLVLTRVYGKRAGYQRWKLRKSFGQTTD